MMYFTTARLTSNKQHAIRSAGLSMCSIRGHGARPSAPCWTALDSPGLRRRRLRPLSEEGLQDAVRLLLLLLLLLLVASMEVWPG